MPKKLKLPNRRSNCPLACTMDLLGDKWTLLIIRDMIRGKHRYMEFAQSFEKMPTNLVSERLDRLIDHSLVERRPLVKGGKRGAYYLTQKGLSLAKVVGVIADWGLEHIEKTELASEIIALRQRQDCGDAIENVS